MCLPVVVFLPTLLSSEPGQPLPQAASLAASFLPTYPPTVCVCTVAAAAAAVLVMRSDY